MSIVIRREDTKRKTGLSHTTQKKQLLKQTCYCNICNYESGYDLQLDHLIPICLGGSQIEQNNLQLICSLCHKKKTQIDILIINMFKKLRLVESFGCGEWFIHVEVEQLKKTYCKIYKNIEGVIKCLE